MTYRSPHSRKYTMKSSGTQQQFERSQAYTINLPTPDKSTRETVADRHSYYCGDMTGIMIPLLMLVFVATRCHGDTNNKEVFCEQICEDIAGESCNDACEIVYVPKYKAIAECRSKCRRELLQCIANCKPPSQVPFREA
ncbi:hypothetical protein LSAT2_015800 [Lamellibrachia satsuma]|nr:hypothetical protein LSAT2_015800 [Lamellibrachia satsuma]